MPGMTDEEKQMLDDIDAKLAKNNATLSAAQKAILLKSGKSKSSTSVEIPSMDQDPKVKPTRRTIDLDK
tara:strand:- start:735 stop:941 length:207 start_codon:yes stop_codon:yes gene_type:complete